MHEMSLAMGLMREIERQLEPYGPEARATRVFLEVGGLRAVVPEAMQLCFRAAAQGTVAEGAELVIEQIAPRGRCVGCGREREIDHRLFLCPDCDLPVRLLTGEELLLRSIEIEEPERKGHK